MHHHMSTYILLIHHQLMDTCLFLAFDTINDFAIKRTLWIPIQPKSHRGISVMGDGIVSLTRANTAGSSRAHLWVCLIVTLRRTD